RTRAASRPAMLPPMTIACRPASGLSGRGVGAFIATSFLLTIVVNTHYLRCKKKRLCRTFGDRLEADSVRRGQEQAIANELLDLIIVGAGVLLDEGIELMEALCDDGANGWVGGCSGALEQHEQFVAARGPRCKRAAPCPEWGANKPLAARRTRPPG